MSPEPSAAHYKQAVVLSCGNRRYAASDNLDWAVGTVVGGHLDDHLLGSPVSGSSSVPGSSANIRVRCFPLVVRGQWGNGRLDLESRHHRHLPRRSRSDVSRSITVSLAGAGREPPAASLSFTGLPTIPRWTTIPGVFIPFAAIHRRRQTPIPWQHRGRARDRVVDI
jgi:hypothetical protein